MPTKTHAVPITLLIIIFISTACSQPAPIPTAIPTVIPTEASMVGEGIKICQVTDSYGINDNDVNMLVWKGIKNSEKQLGIEGKYLESRDLAEYEHNINLLLEDDCDLIIASGSSLGNATIAAAKANPNQDFLIVDFAYDPPINNLSAIEFKVHEAAFLAGYAAAGVSETAKVGTFGNSQIPSVTNLMDGFCMGIQYYNQMHDTGIDVVGWNPEEEIGDFIGNNVTTQDVKAHGEELFVSGVDILMPVTGPAGIGLADLVLELGNSYVVGINTDWAKTSTRYADAVLTSILKNADALTLDAIRAFIEGRLTAGVTVGTLANSGVGLASVSVRGSGSSADVMSWFDDLKIELKEVEQAIVDGQIRTSQ